MRVNTGWKGGVAKPFERKAALIIASSVFAGAMIRRAGLTSDSHTEGGGTEESSGKKKILGAISLKLSGCRRSDVWWYAASQHATPAAHGGFFGGFCGGPLSHAQSPGVTLALLAPRCVIGCPEKKPATSRQPDGRRWGDQQGKSASSFKSKPPSHRAIRW